MAAITDFFLPERTLGYPQEGPFVGTAPCLGQDSGVAAQGLGFGVGKGKADCHWKYLGEQ